MINQYINICRKGNDSRVTVRLPESHFNDLIAIDFAKKHVDHIMVNYSPPYYLLVSGGVDSQAMLWAWHCYGKDFIPVTFKYNNNLNDFDLETLETFSKLHNILIDEKDFDALGFFEGEYFSFVNRYRCGSPHICCYMRLTEEFKDGTVILSGDPFYSIGNFPERNNWCLWQYQHKTQRQIVPSFFIESEHLFNGFYSKFSNKSKKTKADLYNDHGFPVVSQSTNNKYGMMKYTGFEHIKEIYDNNYSHLVTPLDKKIRLPYQGSNRTFDLLLRNKYEHKYRNDLYEVMFTQKDNV